MNKYQEEHFNSTVNFLFNKSPKIEIPEKVEKDLTQKYQEQDYFIRENFKPVQFEL